MQGSVAPVCEGVGSQGVELCGCTAALLTAPFQLPLTQHVHQLNAGAGGWCGIEGFASSHGTRHPLLASRVLFDDMVEIRDLADRDRGPVLGV